LPLPLAVVVQFWESDTAVRDNLSVGLSSRPQAILEGHPPASKPAHAPGLARRVTGERIAAHRWLVLKRFFEDSKQLESKQAQVRRHPAAAKALARYQKEREHRRAKDGV